MKFNYNCYNLTISSDLELPEINAKSSDARKSDVVIHFRDLSKVQVTDGTQIAPYMWASKSTLMIDIPEVARFLISDGDDIAIDPLPGIDEASLRVFLLGSAFGALLMQRGFFVLHGNAVELDDKCLVCVGPSGIGKSSLTAAFMKRGYRVLADDVVPIDVTGHALPGFPRIKLWQDVADKMEIDTRCLHRIRPNLEKFNMPLGDHFCNISRPITHICVLAGHNDETVAITPITGVLKFSVLQENTYRPRFIEGMNLQREHLRQCSALAANVSVAKVQRPKAGFKIDALIDALLHYVL